MIASKNVTVKQVGYIAFQALIPENQEYMCLITQTLRIELLPSSTTFRKCLALTFLANTSTPEMVESQLPDVQTLLFMEDNKATVIMRSALCIQRFYRCNQEAIIIDNIFIKNLYKLLNNTNNIGILLSLMSQLLGIFKNTIDGFEDFIGQFLNILESLLDTSSNTSKNIYKYYAKICPWQQIKILRALQYFPLNILKEEHIKKLNMLLTKIFRHTVTTKSRNKNNSDFSIVFEAINLIIYHSRQIPPHPLFQQAIKYTGKFVSINEPNYRYIALNIYKKLATLPHALPYIRMNYESITHSIQDPDLSIRKRALDILFISCDASLVETTVKDLLLMYENEKNYSIQEEIVQMIVVLTEQYAPYLQWYIDTILQLMCIAEKYITDNIWSRIVEIVTNTEDIQDYVTIKCKDVLQNKKLKNKGLEFCIYIIGEFSYKQLDDKTKPYDILELFLPYHYDITLSIEIKYLLLTALSKLCATFPELQKDILPLFDIYTTSLDMEQQQRSIEYKQILQMSDELINKVLDIMPPWPERENNLLNYLRSTKHDDHVWQKEFVSSILYDPLLLEYDGVDAKELQDDNGTIDKSECLDKDTDNKDKIKNNDMSLNDTLKLLQEDTVTGEEQKNVGTTTTTTSTTTENVGIQESLFSDITVSTETPLSLQTSEKIEIPGILEISPTSISKDLSNKTLLYKDDTISVYMPESINAVDGIQICKLLIEGINYNINEVIINKIDIGLDIEFEIVYNSISLRIICTKGFYENPSISIQYTTNSISDEKIAAIVLPINILHFIIKYNIQAENYLNIWKKQNNQKFLEIPCTTIKNLPDLRKIFTEKYNNNFFIVDNIPENVIPNCIYLSGIFTVYNKDNNNSIPIIILPRLELRQEDNTIRILLRSGDSEISDIVLNVLTKLFQ